MLHHHKQHSSLSLQKVVNKCKFLPLGDKKLNGFFLFSFAFGITVSMSSISRRWTLTLMWPFGLPASDSGRGQRGSAWCSGVWWANLLLIPPLFSTRSAARSRLIPYKARACQICDIIVICAEGRSLRHRCRRLLLWEGLVFSHRDDSWDGEEGSTLAVM